MELGEVAEDWVLSAFWAYGFPLPSQARIRKRVAEPYQHTRAARTHTHPREGWSGVLFPTQNIK